MDNSGPWVLGSHDRPTRLLVGLLRAFGYAGASQISSFPQKGFLVVPAREAHRMTEVKRWASGAGRVALVEPPDGDPIPLSGVPRQLGQRCLSPARTPEGPAGSDDAFLSDVAGVAIAGYEARLRHDRPFPPEWRAFAARAIDELTVKADDAEPLFALRAQLGDAAVLEPPTDAEWRSLLANLDVRRGLFRRSDDAGWELHPRTLWAIAARIQRYRPTPTYTVGYGTTARGTADGPWITRSGDSILRLRASVLSAAAAEMDPPNLDLQYDFSDNAPAPPVHEVLVALAPELNPVDEPDKPFTLCIRHDVDRPLQPTDIRAHLALEEELGLRSTWFFKKETFEESVAGGLLQSSREIGYHAEILSTGDDGFAQQLRGFVGVPVGVTFHGGLGSEGWRGRRSLAEARRAGAAYAELPVGARARPQLWPDDDGDWLPLAPLAVKPDVFPERVRSHLDLLMPGPAVVVVENHPDRLTDDYRALLEGLVSRGPVCRTVGEALEYCRSAVADIAGPR